MLHVVPVGLTFSKTPPSPSKQPFEHLPSTSAKVTFGNSGKSGWIVSLLLMGLGCALSSFLGNRIDNVKTKMIKQEQRADSLQTALTATQDSLSHLKKVHHQWAADDFPRFKIAMETLFKKDDSFFNMDTKKWSLEKMLGLDTKNRKYHIRIEQETQPDQIGGGNFERKRLYYNLYSVDGQKLLTLARENFIAEEEYNRPGTMKVERVLLTLDPDNQLAHFLETGYLK